MEPITISAVDSEHFPTRAHETDAWFDVRANDGYIISPKWFCPIGLWVKVAMPIGKVCLLTPRSSLFKKYWLLLVNSPGVIDAWYRWEIMMQVYNTTDREVIIEHWEKIWQLLFMDYSTEVEISNKYDSFEEEYPSDRGIWWLGSTWN